MSQDSNIRHPVAEPCQDQQAEKPGDYDMKDSQNDLQRWPKLAPVLQDCETTLGEAYRGADSISRKYHFRHKVAGIVAAFGGMFAVLFAIAQLAIAQLPKKLPLEQLPLELSLVRGLFGETAHVWEAVAAFAALVAVVVGLRVALSKEWLVEREKAERCRFEKFGFLISPEAWSDPSNVRQAWLSRRVEDIDALNRRVLKRLAEEAEKDSEPTSLGAAARIDKATLDQLVDYYRVKRLRYQLRYFERQAKRRDLWDWLTWIVPFMFFFLSIAAAFAHYFHVLVEPLLDTFPTVISEQILNVIGTQHSSQDSNELDIVSLRLILAAACLPVIGAAVRILRTAHEFGRNTLRFRATSNNLKRLDLALQKPPDSPAKLKILHEVEEVLEAERREWLRLMLEAEWFG
jgi:hypothetical protein